MDYEVHKPTVKYRTYAFILLFISTLTLYMLYIQSYAQLSQNTLLTAIEYPGQAVSKYLRISPTPSGSCLNPAASEYLVCSSRCKIPNLNPFNDEVKPLYKVNSYTRCTKLPLLTYITVNVSEAILNINQSAVPYYSKNGISCCYSSVTRKPDKNNPDKTINVSTCTPFKDNATLPENFIIVQCANNVTHAQVYKNAHAAITITKNVQKKLEASNNKPYLSVLCVGIDSVSRLNFMREMHETRSFLRRNQWIELEGYNKVADNTYPNLIGLLTGMNDSTSYAKCKPTQTGYLDKCKLIWFDYRDLGYVTGYAEDESFINTFNFNKKGFVNPPTDYYFRPYIIAAEHKLKTSTLDDMTYCTGPETSGERILHLAKDFAYTFKHHPYFGFFWMNTYSHNKLNSISRMDNKVRQFLEDLSESQVLNNTVVIFFSDHGLRFGEIRYTRTGWLEERLPIFFMSVPEWFKKTYPEKYNNLKINRKRLTTPYDVYMMLQEFLVISGKKYSITPGSACVKCKSLFEEIEVDRSCEDASIEQHWCTCGGYARISTKNSTVKAASKYILDNIQTTINSYGKISNECAKLKEKKIMSASISENGANWYKDDTYLLIILQTVPKAVFEATVSVEFKNQTIEFKMQGSISRLDKYNLHSKCTNNSNLKKYCYCRR